jgi:hypothetical protein
LIRFYNSDISELLRYSIRSWRNMQAFSRLICFEAVGGVMYYADLGLNALEIPTKGSSVPAYKSFDDLVHERKQVDVILDKLLPPLPQHDLPIYCVGLNYRTHAEEAQLKVSLNPPLWTKPAAALAAPGEDIYMSNFCASNFPDWVKWCLSPLKNAVI